MTPVRFMVLFVVAAVGVIFMALGGTLFVEQENGRVGNAMLFLLGLMVAAMAVVAGMYGAA
jgi:hypothetical protein